MLRSYADRNAIITFFESLDFQSSLFQKAFNVDLKEHCLLVDEFVSHLVEVLEALLHLDLAKGGLDLVVLKVPEDKLLDHHAGFVPPELECLRKQREDPVLAPSPLYRLGRIDVFLYALKAGLRLHLLKYFLPTYPLYILWMVTAAS